MPLAMDSYELGSYSHIHYAELVELGGELSDAYFVGVHH